MDYKNYSFNTFNKYAPVGIFEALTETEQNDKKPVILCIGSDLVLGDSLGPLVGTMLKNSKVNAYVYGTLTSTITAKEISYIKTDLKKFHPKSNVIAIDACVGESENVGLIRVINKGLKPGLGVNKFLGEVGDISIIGVVAEKSLKNETLFSGTRLNLVYKMAETIFYGIKNYLDYKESENPALDFVK